MSQRITATLKATKSLVVLRTAEIRSMRVAVPLILFFLMLAILPSSSPHYVRAIKFVFTLRVEGEYIFEGGGGGENVSSLNIPKLRMRK